MADTAVPVWVWLPGANEPVQAGEMSPQGAGKTATFSYHPDYLSRPDRLALDPLHLRLRKGAMGLNAADGLPGVVRDAMPAGYGADRAASPNARGDGRRDGLTADGGVGYIVRTCSGRSPTGSRIT